MSETTISSMLTENRMFPPPEEFQSKAYIKSEEEYDRLWTLAKDHPEKFWGDQGKSLLDWHKPFTKVLEWDAPVVKWFGDGTLNACYNCVDRHLENRADKPAIIWEGEPGDSRTISYQELYVEVCKFANGLKKLGLSKGDVATIYMPMIPELTIAVLACARIGVTHNVIFGGFSAEAIADRNNDAKAKVVITADGGYRRGKIIPLKEQVDKSIEHSPTVQHVVVCCRTKQDIVMNTTRDIWLHDLISDVSDECPPEFVSSEHPLFILYTSGSTGKPKGIEHTTGGYLLGVTLSSRYVFDLKEDDVYWCTADVGWVTGHSYIVYGPLANGATCVMYEGAPDYPDFGRFWSIVEKYGVSILYTAPTAIRAFIKAGDEYPEKYNLDSLRLLGTVGEPINPEAWMWYREKIGKNKCPIVDTWWQTETGSIMISPLPGVTSTLPGSATKPFFGVVPEIVDESGNKVPDGKGGYLVISQPWPSMLRTIHGDADRFKETYWSQVPGKYFTGDGARKDENGYFWILGRIDDVLNVSGHRLSTMEIESALASHTSVAEAAVVGTPHDLKGEAIFCFVSLDSSIVDGDRESLKKQLISHVAEQIGAIAKPDEIRFTEALPKTRSGKIMRRLLRDIAAGRETQGDTTTLEDHGVLDSLRK